LIKKQNKNYIWLFYLISCMCVRESVICSLD
jgi:hypothetical protein